MDYTLRPATAADFDDLFALHRATMRSYVDRTWGWDDAQQLEFFRRNFAPERLQVIEVDGPTAGVLALERNPGDYFLVSIEIDPASQRRGLGTAIICAFMHEAALAGAPVRLRVLKVNPARALYERLGFRVTGELPTHFLMQAHPSPRA